MQQIKNICISSSKGPKTEVGEVEVVKNLGIKGDFHASAASSRQVSFLPEALINTMPSDKISLYPGIFGENFILSGLDFTTVRKKGTIEIGDVVVEITQIGKKCPAPCHIYKTVGRCIMPEYGFFGIVRKGGVVKRGDSYSCRF